MTQCKISENKVEANCEVAFYEVLRNCSVSFPQAEIGKIVLGASKLIDGEIVVDKDKQVELEAEANKVMPTAEQQLISTLMLKFAKLEAGA